MLLSGSSCRTERVVLLWHRRSRSWRWNCSRNRRTGGVAFYIDYVIIVVCTLSPRYEISHRRVVVAWGERRKSESASSCFCCFKMYIIGASDITEYKYNIPPICNITVGPFQFSSIRLFLSPENFYITRTWSRTQSDWSGLVNYFHWTRIELFISVTRVSYIALCDTVNVVPPRLLVFCNHLALNDTLLCDMLTKGFLFSFFSLVSIYRKSSSNQW